MEIVRIEYPSPFEEVYSLNDNIDVLVHLADGNVYSFVVATPNNIFWCMQNENLDYFFGVPPVFVKDLTRDNIERALRAIVNEENGKWLDIYGSRQES